MSLENVRQFEEMLIGDEALQARLRELSGAFGGDGQDARALFETVVAPLAEEVGLPYTYDEALEVLPQQSDDDLGADEARAVAAGTGAGCLFIGVGGTTANACSDDESGINACFGLGLGFAYS